MSVLSYLSAMVLAACIVITAATGETLGPLWIPALGLAAPVQAAALYRRYQHG